MSRKKGGIVGRSSKQTIDKRRRICQELYYSCPNLTQRGFIERYITLLENNKMDVPKEQTLKNDIKKLGFSFHKSLETLNPAKTNFRNMGHRIRYCLRQIRINCICNDMVLYDSDTSFHTTAEYNFSKSLDQLKNMHKDDANSTVIADTSLICLSFILNEKGFEIYIEDVFNTWLKSTCNYLYSETHNYCTKIYFEYKELAKIMEYVYHLIRELDIYDK